jgi:hypothetical protein
MPLRYRSWFEGAEGIGTRGSARRSEGLTARRKAFRSEEPNQGLIPDQISDLCLILGKIANGLIKGNMELAESFVQITEGVSRPTEKPRL